MRKLLLLITALTFISLSSSAQTAVVRGDQLFNIGVGLSSTYRTGIPFGADYEIAFTDHLSLGGSLEGLFKNIADNRYTVLYGAARAAWHIPLESETIDVYGGGSLGYRHFSWKKTYTGEDDPLYRSRMLMGAFTGVRWFFKGDTGAFAEMGVGGLTNFRVGIAFRY